MSNLSGASVSNMGKGVSCRTEGGVHAVDIDEYSPVRGAQSGVLAKAHCRGPHTQTRGLTPLVTCNLSVYKCVRQDCAAQTR